MEAAAELLKRGVHRSVVLRGFAAASQRLQTMLPQHAISWSPDTDEGRTLLLQIASTALSSKLAGQVSDKLAAYGQLAELFLMSHSLATRARMTAERNQILVQVAAGGTLADAFLLPFSCITCPPDITVVPEQPVRVALLSFAIDKVCDCLPLV